MRKKRIMVCVTQQKSCERLIAQGAAHMRKSSDELHVIHVVKENWRYFGQLKEADALEYLFDISKQHGASLSVIKAKDIEQTLGTYAEDHRIDTIVMGESFEKDEQQNMIHRLENQLNRKIQVEIVPFHLNEESTPSQIV